MKRVGAFVAVILFSGLLLLFILRPFSPPATAPETVPGNSTALVPNSGTSPTIHGPSNAVPAIQSQEATTPGAANVSNAPGTNEAQGETAINLPPETILQNIRRVVHLYGDTFGGDPVGTNPEITAALNGHNPKQINFLRDQPGVQINANGEMIDSWGTPYFFHQLSAHVMEIHSAGPDKIMWTSDDLVTQ
jgi:hypothetical protein